MYKVSVLGLWHGPILATHFKFKENADTIVLYHFHKGLHFCDFLFANVNKEDQPKGEKGAYS